VKPLCDGRFMDKQSGKSLLRANVMGLNPIQFLIRFHA
jgi:hypothetical protein